MHLPSVLTIAITLAARIAVASPTVTLDHQAVFAGHGSTEEGPSPRSALNEDMQLEMVKEYGIEYQLVSHPSFPSYSLKLKKPSGLCDDSVKQWSGYLDVAEGHHLFFWYFESRKTPEIDPLMMWINGGPGCSSMLGLLTELGPCNVTPDNTTEFNPYSWNEEVNLVFLDEPVNVGLSWSTSTSNTVQTSPEAAVDVYAFLQLFLKNFPALKERDFHLAGESYGGTYVPNFSNYIWKKNLDLETTHNDNVAPINLKTAMIGNGIGNPLIQYQGDVEYLCDSPYKLLNDSVCSIMKQQLPYCVELLQLCYDSPSVQTCQPADGFCASALNDPFYGEKRNPYDVREKCDIEKGVNECWKQGGWVQGFLNQQHVKEELGVPDHVDFASCNDTVGSDFYQRLDRLHPHYNLLIPLIDNGIRVLFYVGEDDFICNYAGNKLAALDLNTTLKETFNTSPDLPYMPRISGEPTKKAGMVRTAGEGAGNFTFLTIENAPHYVPTGQPRVALDMLKRWLGNQPF